MEYDFNNEEFRNSSIYKTFINNNSGKGVLKVEASTPSEAYPLKGVEIIISKTLGNNKIIFFKGVTNDSGIIDGIVLPAKAMSYEVNDTSDILYTTYDLDANLKEYNLNKDYNVTIFDNIKVIQPVTFSVTELIGGEDNE